MSSPLGTVAVVSLMTGSVVSNIVLPKSNSLSPTSLPTNNSYLGDLNDTASLNDTIFSTTFVPTIESTVDNLTMQKLALASSMCFLVGVVQVF